MWQWLDLWHFIFLFTFWITHCLHYVCYIIIIQGGTLPASSVDLLNLSGPGKHLVHLPWQCILMYCMVHQAYPGGGGGDILKFLTFNWVFITVVWVRIKPRFLKALGHCRMRNLVPSLLSPLVCHQQIDTVNNLRCTTRAGFPGHLWCHQPTWSPTSAKLE